MTAIALGQARQAMPRVSRPTLLVALFAAAAVLYLVFRDRWLLPHDDSAPVFGTFNDVRSWVEANRQSNPLLSVVVAGIRAGVGVLFDVVLAVLHALGWPGLVAVAGSLGLVFSGWRLALLAAGGVLSFGILGLWEPSIETLALTLTAVIVSLSIGIPIGILAGRSDRVMRLVSPVLDVMQIMPSFAYLAPLALFFSIGPPAAAIVTMIYAIPPAIRFTALGIRGVSPDSVEASTSMGGTRTQTLRFVQLPMARRIIVLGINQTMMMALAMVVITVLISGPGLGQNIIFAVIQVDVGAAFDAGLAIVIMAIVLDRLTTAASDRAEPRLAGQRAASAARRRALLLGAAAVCVVGAAAGMFVLGSDFPATIHVSFREPVNAVTDWIAKNLFALTTGTKNAVTFGLINPLETVLTSAPWWLVGFVVVGLAALVSGSRAAVTTAVCLGLLAALSLWEHSMQTLTTVLVGTALTLAIGTALGIWSARSDRVAAILRPFLDAAQTMPAFVYLLPAVALFENTRFTAIVAAIIYAVPPVIRLVEAGIRQVSATVVEAATAAGATPRQLLWKVQLPMARHALLLAANQGIVLVLAMVVVGGLVGAGALGYDVVAGFAQRRNFGEGLAAGIAIVVLGVMLDRITQGAGRVSARGEGTPATPHA